MMINFMEYFYTDILLSFFRVDDKLSCTSSFSSAGVTFNSAMNLGILK
jgi:hypothetical protein